MIVVAVKHNLKLLVPLGRHVVIKGIMAIRQLFWDGNDFYGRSLSCFKCQNKCMHFHVNTIDNFVPHTKKSKTERLGRLQRFFKFGWTWTSTARDNNLRLQIWLFRLPEKYLLLLVLIQERQSKSFHLLFKVRCQTGKLKCYF